MGQCECPSFLFVLGPKGPGGQCIGLSGFRAGVLTQGNSVASPTFSPLPEDMQQWLETF